MLDLLLFGQKTAPDFFWNARSGVLPAGATFTRASAGWSFNSAGVLTQAGSNVARFDYDPATLQPLGYLAEMQSTNNVIRSWDIANAEWSKTFVTVTGNAIVSPDGTANAATVTEDASTNRHEIGNITPFSSAAGSVYGGSFFVKNVTGSRWVVASVYGADITHVSVNPSTGTLGSLGAAISNASIRSVGNGWYRVQFQWTAPSVTSNGFYFSMQTADTGGATQTRAGDGTSAVSIWGAQWEPADVGVTSYIPTAGAAVTRAGDILSMPLASLPGWRPTQGGVLVATYRLHTVVPNGAQTFLSLGDGTDSNKIAMVALPGIDSRWSFQTSSGGVIQINSLNGSNPAVFTRKKSAGAWSTSHFAQASDGTLDASGNGSYALPMSPTTLYFGSRNGNLSFLAGTLESIAYYAGARSDAFAQQVSR